MRTTAWTTFGHSTGESWPCKQGTWLKASPTNLRSCVVSLPLETTDAVAVISIPSGCRSSSRVKSPQHGERWLRTLTCQRASGAAWETKNDPWAHSYSNAPSRFRAHVLARMCALDLHLSTSTGGFYMHVPCNILAGNVQHRICSLASLRKCCPRNSAWLLASLCAHAVMWWPIPSSFNLGAEDACLRSNHVPVLQAGEHVTPRLQAERWPRARIGTNLLLPAML